VSGTTTRVALYRAYGADDTLLYVGITTNPAQRWKEHFCEKPWWREVSRKTVEWYDSRELAGRAEAVVVRDEKPAYNRTLPAEDGSYSHRPVAPRVAHARPRFGRFRCDDDLWEAFGDAVKAADPEADRSAVLRAVIRWYVGQPNARLPERPNTDVTG
jgi:predicted GIY-YIG superfamily endonuclease